MLLLSFNCHCACPTTDESQQQEQHYTVTTIIKRLSQKYWTIYVNVSVCCCCCVIFLLFICNCGCTMADEQQEQHETVTTTITQKNLYKLLSVGELIFEIDWRSYAPLLINLRPTEPNYIKSITDIAQCTYSQVRCTPLLIHLRPTEPDYTKSVTDIAQCTYTQVRCPPTPFPYSTMHIYPEQMYPCQ